MVASGSAAGSVSQSDIVDRLSLVGLEVDDARAIVQLSISGAQPASALAKSLDVSRAAAYRLLGRLTEQGHVIASTDHPTKFSAAPLGGIIDSLVAMQQARLEQTKSLREDLEAAVRSLQQKSAPEDEACLFRIVRSRPSIHLIADVMIREANKSVEVIATHGRGVLEARVAAWAHTATANDVSFRAVVAAKLEDASGSLDNGVRDAIRVAPDAPPMALVVVDGTDVLLWVVREETTRMKADGDTAIWTNDPGFAAAQSAVCAGHWQAAMVDEEVTIRAKQP